MGNNPVGAHRCVRPENVPPERVLGRTDGSGRTGWKIRGGNIGPPLRVSRAHGAGRTGCRIRGESMGLWSRSVSGAGEGLCPVQKRFPGCQRTERKKRAMARFFGFEGIVRKKISRRRMRRPLQRTPKTKNFRNCWIPNRHSFWNESCRFVSFRHSR